MQLNSKFTQYIKVFFSNIILLILLQSCNSHLAQDNKSAKMVYYQKKSLHKCSENNQAVLVGGCFDLLHYGHIQFLRKARAQGKYLIVALEPDESIINYKKRQPIHNQLQRADALASLRFVDEVIMLPSLKGFDDYNQLVQDVCPSVIAVTANDPQLKNKQLQAKLIEAKVVEVIDLVKNQGAETLSNTVIINKLSE